MYRGKIIIISDIPSIRDYVDDNLVLFYTPEDAVDLAHKIEYIYENKNTVQFREREKLIKQEYLSSFSFGSFIERVVKVVMDFSENNLYS